MRAVQIVIRSTSNDTKQIRFRESLDDLPIFVTNARIVELKTFNCIVIRSIV